MEALSAGHGRQNSDNRRFIAALQNLLRRSSLQADVLSQHADNAKSCGIIAHFGEKSNFHIAENILPHFSLQGKKNFITLRSILLL